MFLNLCCDFIRSFDLLLYPLNAFAHLLVDIALVTKLNFVLVLNNFTNYFHGSQLVSEDSETFLYLLCIYELTF